MSGTTYTEPLSRLRVGPSAFWPLPAYLSHFNELLLSCVDAEGLSTSGGVSITLKETNDFPPQVVPGGGFVCKEATPEASGLVVTAVDQDFPPHAAPFRFEIPDDLPVNWTLSQLNSTQRRGGRR